MDAESFGREIHVLAAVKVKIGQLSSGRAAELAGMSRVEFLLSLNHYKVFPLASELEEFRKRPRLKLLAMLLCIFTCIALVVLNYF